MSKPAPAALRLDDVSVRYGDVVALDRLSLNIEVGEHVALLGPSGAGKSTILGLAAGRVGPTNGAVEVLGDRWAELSASSARRLRRSVGVVHQQLDLVDSLRVVHNVNAGRLGEWSLPQTLWSLIRPVESDEARDVLEPLGLADRLHERTDRLSGGQRQRVAIARALRQRAELVLADEPISAVDPAWRERVLALLISDAEARGATLVVSSHDAPLALRSFPRVVGISSGRVAFDLASTDVTEKHLAELYGLERA